MSFGSMPKWIGMTLSVIGLLRKLEGFRVGKAEVKSPIKGCCP